MADVVPLVPKSSTEPSIAQFFVGHTFENLAALYYGRHDLNFTVEANRRAIDGMVVLYDIVANGDERKKLRKCFRQFMARHGGRLAPYYPELHAPMRTRLREHKMFVRLGLDPPDEPRKRNGRA